MIARLVAGVMGVIQAATGAFILLAPAAFFRLTPGVAMTGPMNPHFLTDVGLAFLASGAIVVVGAWMDHRAIAAAGALWLVLHALFHVVGLISGMHGAGAVDLLSVVLPVAILVIAVGAMRPERRPSARQGDAASRLGRHRPHRDHRGGGDRQG